MITVRDLIDLFVDDSWQELEIYDINKGEVVFKGTTEDDGYEKFEDYEVCSIDNINKNTDVFYINIEMED